MKDAKGEGRRAKSEISLALYASLGLQPSLTFGVIGAAPVMGDPKLRPKG